MTRTAHYVRSSHWDREWYEPFQHLRMRLVATLDEVLTCLAADPEFRYTMDGQSIPIEDYLEVRPERAADVRCFAAEGRLTLGPWYVAPDEWLVSGESLMRNLEMGLAYAAGIGGICRAGFVCDQFGHVGQLPQIFDQFGITAAYVWRGTNERTDAGHFLWQSPDGTALPTYRFGLRGYGMLAYGIRSVFADEPAFDREKAVDKLVAYTRAEAARSPLSPVLLFDGVDHLEVEPRMAGVITAANQQLAADGIVIVSSDLDRYQKQVADERGRISKTIIGELRATCGEPGDGEEQWMIGGTYASRIGLKQSNAACEDELCLWAEPFSAFATNALGLPHPDAFLQMSWKHLLQNHPHDSICGCSTDAVHRDMVYRFEQSMQIASKLSEKALAAITAAAARGPITIGVFNATAVPVDHVVDLDVLLPNDWPMKYSDNFASQQKFAFRLRGPDGAEVPYQLLSQRSNESWRRTLPYKLSYEGTQHHSRVAARVTVPAFGYTTLTVEPSSTPTRYTGPGMATSRSIESETLKVTVNSNGTLRLEDKRSGHTFDQLLTFEDCADIGNGWFHGIAVNDARYTSAACTAQVSIIADGPLVATLRIDLTMQVPAAFDRHAMRRDERLVPLRSGSEVTLRSGSSHLEIKVTIDNTARDHRLRVLLPTGLAGDVFWCDAPFDCVEHRIAPPADNDRRREMDLETRAQQSWTAYGNDRAGLVVIARGLPEVAVPDRADRPIALTLLRGFARVISRDDDAEGQVLGPHVFRFSLLPYVGPLPPVKQVYIHGQRAGGIVRQATHTAADIPPVGSLPPAGSFLDVAGDVVVTSVRRQEDATVVRCFNPSAGPVEMRMGDKTLDVPTKRIVIVSLPIECSVRHPPSR